MTEAMRPSGGAASRILKQALTASTKTVWLIIRITLPVSLAVALLDWLGAIEAVAGLLDPVMVYVGLPGEASLVLLSSAFLNIYSAIAAIQALGLSGRALGIIAIMCLSAHNLPLESAIMRKTGSSIFKMVLLRLAVMILAGLCFNLILPKDGPPALEPAVVAEAAAQADLKDAAEEVLVDTVADTGAEGPVAQEPGRGFAAYLASRPSIPGALWKWARDTGILLIKMIVIVSLIMVLQKVLDEFGFMKALSRVFSPLLRAFGLPAGTSVLWIIIQVVGYGYGAAIILEQIAQGKISQRDADLLNHHAAVCHSLLEDSLLFASIGAPLFWITLPRLVLAAAVVWLERARRHLFRRSFRVGTV
jgi:hypothetical protein